MCCPYGRRLIHLSSASPTPSPFRQTQDTASSGTAGLSTRFRQPCIASEGRPAGRPYFPLDSRFHGNDDEETGMTGRGRKDGEKEGRLRPGLVGGGRVRG